MISNESLPVRNYILSKKNCFLCLHVIRDSKSPKPQKPKGKEKRVWEMGGTSTKDLDYSGTNKNLFNHQSQDEFSVETVGIESNSDYTVYHSYAVHFPFSYTL